MKVKLDIRQKYITVIAALLFAAALTLGMLAAGPTVAADPEGSEITISSAEDFIDYSQEYALGQHSPTDRLTISITAGASFDLDGFVSLGTSARPFAGEINIMTTGINTFILYNTPLFDYVSTDMRFTGSAPVFVRKRPTSGSSTGGPLLASNVTAGSGSANWSLTLESSETAYSGVIGTIATGANVAVNFTNNSSAVISGSSDVGLIAGSLGSGATLDVTTAGSASELTVTSTGGHAGSVVGSMAAGSVLSLKSANNTGVTAVTTSGSGKYAGGLVGYNNGGSVSLVGISSYAVGSITVTGREGAGGVFGYYKNTGTNASYDCAVFPISGATVSATTYTGGLFGLLENSGSLTVSGSVTANISGGSYRGGIAGGYCADTLTSTLSFSNVTTVINVNSSKYTGGLIGGFPDSGKASYVSISGVTCTVNESTTLNNNTNLATGGLVGYTGTAGNFIDVSGNVTINGKLNAGLVGHLDEGILRLAGVTDISGFVAMTGENRPRYRGQIVYKRGRSLVYALGDGNGTGWTLKRNTGFDRSAGNYDNTNTLNLYNLDDIKDWGQVLRVDGTKLTEPSLFTLDMTAHTVTVKGAKTTIANVTDFALTALNFQLNTGDKGALRFESSTRSSTLLSGTFTLTADIDLSGTGLTGFTRDNADSAGTEFKGALNGGGHTITLATGEVYGCDANGTALVDVETGGTSRFGYIETHENTGLFAKLGGGASISNLTVDGYINFSQGNNNMKIGGVCGTASGTVTLTNVTVAHKLNYMLNYPSDLSYIGGAVGYSAGATITFSGGNYGAEIEFKVLKISDGTATYVGGVIGYMTNTAQSVSFSGTTLAVRFSVPTVSGVSFNKNVRFGGAIGYIDGLSSAKTVTFTGVTVDGLEASMKLGSNTKDFLSVLGSFWLNTNVSINSLTISDASLTATSGSVAAGLNVGALVHTATGHWDVQSISIETNGLSITLPSGMSGSSFGFIANKGYRDTGAMYLDLDNIGTNYNISALAFEGTPSFAVYDEIVAYSKVSGSIEGNGQAIISVTTTDGQPIRTTGGCNTYLNKTAYGIANHSINPNTRYYYNLEAIRTAASKTEAQKLLLWSVKTYAHSSIQSWFPVSSTTFTGDLDMRGLSYYPVSVSGASLTFNNATLTFDNAGLENTVIIDSTTVNKRTTLASTSQHYLMHAGLFLDYVGSLTVNGLTVVGNVPLIGGNSGFLIRGSLSGTSTGTSSLTVTGLSLGKYANSTYSPALILSGGNRLSGDAYAPLLINRIGSYTNVTITTVTQPGYGASFTGYAASSLIGDVGEETASNIDIEFSDLRLDGRTAANTPGGLTQYGTQRSIFCRATLLNSYRYARDCTAAYNFTVLEDWNSKTGATAVHNVTYGKEISASIEYEDMQNKYYPVDASDKPRRYVNYASNSNAANVSFSAFLPYVYLEWENGGLKPGGYHEIAVNIAAEGVLTAGCGKYGDPYIIDDGSQLEMIAVILGGTGISKTYQISLPASLDYAAACNNNDYVYQFNGTEFVSDGHASKSLNAVREYLAGAYYIISADITLTQEFKGLGRPSESYLTSFSCPYAFRGVIVGVDYTPVDEEGEPTGEPARKPIITNESANPLIYSSNGCVVKDLTIAPRPANGNRISLKVPVASANEQTFLYNGGLDTYGAVIGRIMGGDTVIDAVTVDYADMSFVYDSTAARQRLVPVGGYVGVILNGGLIFRNMTDTTGLTSAKFARIGDQSYLYVNPFIGRVIAGYAVNESNAYRYTEATATLKNGRKNYSIPDIKLPSSESDKLGVANNKIIIPDGQSLYILSLIINSGAGSANGLAGYAEFASTPWSAFRSYTVSRGGASYSSLGNYSAADCTAANGETSGYAGSNKIPYIISKFTAADGGVYRARGLGSYSNYAIELVSGHTYSLPEAYRGIGSIYYDDALLRLRFTSFDGKNCTITNNMRFFEYDQSNSLAYKAATCIANGGAMVTAGIGLFNQVVQQNASASNAIKDLVLAGSIYYDVYNLSTGNKSAYLNDTSADGVRNNNGSTGNSNNDRTYLAAGGFAGYVHGKFYISNVTFSGLSVESAHGAGGLIGLAGGDYTNESKIVYTVAASGSVNVTGAAYAGGIIGRIDLAAVTIEGASGSTKLYANVSSKSTGWNDDGDNYEGEIYSGIGGVLGTIRGYIGSPRNGPVKPIIGGQFTFTMPVFNVSNITVCSPANGSCSISWPTESSENDAFAGGVIGNMHRIYAVIHNVTVENIDISAQSAGGVIGHASQRFYLELIDVTVNGVNKTKSITGVKYAGGVVGRCYCNDEYMMYFDGVTVNGFNIVSSETGANSGGAGGVFGRIKTNTANNNPFILRNISVENCAISVSGTSGTRAAGGLVGLHENSSIHIQGYNLLIGKGTSVTSTGSNIGTVVGSNNNASFKLVGVSTAGMTIANFNNSAQYTKNNGYVIFANYSGATGNSAFTTGVGAVTNVIAAEPFVTVNPSLGLGGITLTGDGVSPAADTSAQDAYNGLTLTDVLYQILNGSGGRYTYAASAAKLTLMNGHKNDFAMFSTLAGAGYSGVDFVVPVLEDSAAVHEFINTYIQLLTNTAYDFSAANSSVYSVVISRAAYQNGAFVLYDSDVSLKLISGSGFSIGRNDFDNGKAQFSLIDVRFKDPSVTDSVAYHLYIPVVVKKIITYDFNVSAAGGTKYLPSDSSRFGKALIENTGLPVTLYFEYVYSSETVAVFRSKQDWINALNGGEILARNYDKYLSFAPANTNLPSLPGNTILVLVDPNDGGKAYYAYFDQAFTNGYLDLTKFKTDLSREASDDRFTPLNLDLVFGITVRSVNEGGTLVRCAVGETALFTAKDGYGYRAATDTELADSTKTKYTVTDIDNFIERYFLTVQTGEGETVYHYVVSPTADLTGSMPIARIRNANATNAAVHLIMGKIFKQSSFTLASSSKDGSDLMSAVNDVLSADMSVVIELDSQALGSLTSEIQSYFASVETYQSFIVYLTRTEDGVPQRVILGSPTGAGTYSIGGGQAAAYAGSNIRITPLYAEFVTGNISTSFTSGTRTTITSNVSLTYPAADISTQFPARDGSMVNSNGVTVSAASNIAFSLIGTSYSKNSVSANDNPPHLYYSEGESEQAELHLGVIGDREGDYNPLGINPKNLRPGVDSYEFTLAGMLDITGIYRQIGNDYRTVRVSVTLSQKSDGEYGEPLELADYMRGITPSSALTVDRSDPEELVFTFARDDTAEILLPDIVFSVITGTDFEEAGHTYTNYKITVSVSLQNGQGETFENSVADNYVIYTHAKVLTDYIESN